MRDGGDDDVVWEVEAGSGGGEPAGRRPLAKGRWAVGIAAGVALSGLVALLVTPPGGDGARSTIEVATEEPEPVEVTADIETTTTAPATIDVATTQPPQTATTATTRRTSLQASATTTSAPPPPKPVCRNSKDPACGPFYWDPDPGPNQPLTASWVTEPPARWNTRDGRFPVEKLAYNYSDPDSFFIYEYLTVNRPAVQRDCSNPEPQYGPWSPPHTGYSSAGTNVPGSGDVGVIPTEGTAVFHLALGTGACGYRDPYASHVTLTATVEMYYE